MAKYHINPKTGRPNLCSAGEGNCPYRNEDGTPAPHFETKTEARAYNETEMNKQYKIINTISKKNNNNADNSYTTTIPAYNLEKIQERIAKKNKRLKNSGFKEKFDVKISAPYLKKVTNGRIPQYVSMIDITINKPIISLGKYDVVGSIDKEEGGLVYKNFGGENYTPDMMVCDHCEKKAS